MRKVISSILLFAFMLTISSCGDDVKVYSENAVEDVKVSLTVVTTFAGSDGSSNEYNESCAEWSELTGNSIIDMSSMSDESFKMRVVNDFETGSEPDVLFFFTGADANNFIQGNRVVSIDEIREEYPEFASNMKLDMLPTSIVDGKAYALPVNSYWEALYVNREVLDSSGVEMPGADYSWEQFLLDCGKIKAAGYTPIACALGNIPHYWWEFSIFNRTGIQKHLTIPKSTEDELGQAWIDAMGDIKSLYELGFFPWNTNSATDDETFDMFMNGRAAFLIDGSWKLGSIVQNCQSDLNDPSTLDKDKLSKFSVTFVPTMGKRKATDLIGGMSMGYYITRKAWNDPEKRDAAVSFVSYMTSDEVVMKFTKHTSNLLLKDSQADTSMFNSLQLDAIEMMDKCTSLTSAVQDIFQGDCRVSTFDNMPAIVGGRVDIEDAVNEGLSVYWEDNK